MQNEMRGTIRATSLIVGGVIAIAIVIEGMHPTQAQPPFAQAMGTSCDVCHSSIPALNAYGRYVQRTSYDSITAAVAHGANPVWFEAAPFVNSQDPMSPGKVQVGNVAVHVAGFIGSDITVHLHQWIVKGNEPPSGSDTLWVAYNNLFRRDGHLTLGYLPAPAPAPFSNWWELSGFAAPEMMVGEHMYEYDMMRWGYKLGYNRPDYIVEAAYVGPNSGSLNAAFNFTSPPTDKTWQYRVAYARADSPFEAGVYLGNGQWPLSDGTLDNYASISPYVQLDPYKGWPGVFAFYQSNHDANAGPGFGPANSGGFAFDLNEPLFNNKVMLGERYEGTFDPFGSVSHDGEINLGIVLAQRVSTSNANALVLNGQVRMFTGSTAPGWSAQLFWHTTVGNMRGLSRGP
jgi:hypothetical protein